MKQFKIIIVIIFLFQLFIPIYAIAETQTIGFCVTDTIHPNYQQESIIEAFKLGVHNVVGEDSAKKIYFHRAFTGKPLAVLDCIAEFKKRNIKVFAGFPSSKEALLVLNTISEQDYNLLVFSGAGHHRINSFGKGVFSTGESMHSNFLVLTKFIKEKDKQSNIYFLLDKSSVFSMSQHSILSAYNKVGKEKLNIITLPVNADRKINHENLQSVLPDTNSFIYVSLYPYEAYNILRQLGAANIQTTLLINSAWKTSDIHNINNFINSKKASVYSVEPKLVSPQNKSEAYVDIIENKYQNKSDVNYAYDTGTIIGAVIKNNLENKTKQQLSEFVYSAFKCNSSSEDRFCFTKNGSNAIRPLNIIKHN